MGDRTFIGLVQMQAITRARQ